MNEFTVDANFKSTSAGGDQFHRLDPSNVANFGRQTGGSWFIVSNRAVFDRDACFHRAPSKLILSCVEIAGQARGRARSIQLHAESVTCLRFGLRKLDFLGVLRQSALSEPRQVAANPRRESQSEWFDGFAANVCDCLFY
jgi:hypothetical protein